LVLPSFVAKTHKSFGVTKIRKSFGAHYALCLGFDNKDNRFHFALFQNDPLGDHRMRMIEI
jgi:hypothetical protein